MTVQEKVALVQALANNDSTATTTLVTALLNKAESAIRNRMYPIHLPLDNTGQEIPFVVPAKYEVLQCDLAMRYFSRLGGEGEKLHIENGIDRHYDSVNDEDLLMEVMQVIV